MPRTGPPQVPYCPQGRFDCLNVRTSDNQILTACALLTLWSAGAEADLQSQPTKGGCAHRRLWVSAAVGLTWLLIFGIFRDKIAVYRTRLVSSLACASTRKTPLEQSKMLLQSRYANQRVAGLQDMPNVWIKPPPLPVGGIKQLWFVAFTACANLCPSFTAKYIIQASLGLQDVAVSCDHDVRRGAHPHRRTGLVGARP